jgi:lytic murein transglycosylase
MELSDRYRQGTIVDVELGTRGLLRRSSYLFIVFLVGLLTAAPPSARAASFDDWVFSFKQDAMARGVSANTLDQAFAGVTMVPRVLELDRKQPEFLQTFWRYLDARVTPARIERGRAMLVEHAALLEMVQKRYGVQPRFLVAFWALESNFGDDTGSFPLVASLATLAYDSRRSGFFREQLLTLLQLIDRGDVSPYAQGSWAGAFGQTQFIPSTFKAYAVDFDGDGHPDLWNSLPDVFASSANYLSSIGWDADGSWGREVVLPYDFPYALTGLDTEKPVSEWARLGVLDLDGGPLPPTEQQASLLLPGGINSGPALLVYRNFRKIMNWNNAVLYAVSVGHLADRIAGGGSFATIRLDEEKPMTRQQVEEMQYLLSQKGLDTGGVDGLVGTKTKEAIKRFQQQASLPADGYPTLALLDQLRSSQ